MEVERSNELEAIEQTSTNQHSQQFDIKRILKLIINPLDSLKLTDKDFLHGIIGLASSYIAYLLWSLFVTKRLNAIFNPFYEFASIFGGGSSQGSLFFKMYSKLMLTGLWSILSLVAVIWLVSWWISGSRPDIKSLLTRIGGIHYIGAVGFLLASILSVSFNFSLLIIVITLLSVLLLTIYAAAQLYEIAREKLSLYFMATIAGYVILFSVIPQLLF